MPTNTRPAVQQLARGLPRPRPTTSRAVERATYNVNSRKRVLFTISTDGTSKLIDAPIEHYDPAATGLATPDTFVVEPQLPDADTRELEAIVADYLTHAALHDRVPMKFSKLGDSLKALTA